MKRRAVDGGQPVRTKPFPRWPHYDDEEMQEIVEALRAGPWSAGSPKIRLFEEEFASFHQTKFGIACSSGSVALFISLKAIGIGPGDQVIIPAYTFLATATAVIDTGATPVIVDIDPNTYNIDPAAAEKAITAKTKCIIPVHLAGCPADMDAVQTLAEKHGLHVIEDAAQAHGAEWKGRKAGSMGTMAGFSFYQSKNMAAGEGGIITTNDEKLASIARSLVNVGRDVEKGWYEHVRYGWNYRMTAFQAAVLRAQLRRLPQMNAKRAKAAEYLGTQLAQIDGIDPMPKPPEVTAHSYHLFIVRVQPSKFGFQTKEQLVKALNAEGIPCNAGYKPLNSYPFIAEKSQTPSPVSVAEKASKQEALWIPQYVLLGEKDDLDDVVEAFQKLRQAAET